MFFRSKNWEWPLDNEVQASFIASVLEEEGIPFRIIRHGESPWGTAFEVMEGFGHLEVPDDYQAQVRELWKEMKESQIQEEDS